MLETKYVERVAGETHVQPTQAAKAIALFDEGATIPFVARYRKDVTGNLDETHLEQILTRTTYYQELNQRKRTVLDAIDKQGKLTDELRAQIEGCFDKTALEDLYLPFKKPKRTKAAVAREKGLEPLAAMLWEQAPDGPDPMEFAQQFVDAEKDVPTAEDALEGARYIVAEQISVDAGVRSALRERMAEQGNIAAFATKNTEGKKTKYETYYDFREAVGKIPSHRFLAILRGVKEGSLRMELEIDNDAILAQIEERIIRNAESPCAAQLKLAVEDAYRRLLRPSIENEVLNHVRRRADQEAIRVFRENAENLLLAPPAGALNIIGIDPGMRTGCKLAVVDKQGTYKESNTIFPTPPQNETEKASEILLDLIKRYDVDAVAIGNGTGAREATAFVRPLLAKCDKQGVFCVLVNEAGASIYSASKQAREEFPDLDISIRGAISIARRLQDPLSELVKIDPRHIGVGQYQHDVNQKALREGLHRTVVSCVNRVGVNLNTASAHLLHYISGMRSHVAHNILEKRQTDGPFTNRQQLLEVEGVGPRVFEQAAGFLRIPDGDNPLDATGIHPEAYPVAERIAESLEVTPKELIGNEALLRELDVKPFVTDTIGELTLADIRAELLKPGRDPRKEFRAPQFLEGVNSLEDLQDGMDVEGVVTNVTDFGAFVDIGVHQDGLVHLSELANRYIEDPHNVVKVGDIVKVRVLKVDRELSRISLSMKALQPARPPAGARRRGGEPQKDAQESSSKGEKPERSKDAAASNDGKSAPAASGKAETQPQRKPEKGASAKRRSKQKAKGKSGERSPKGAQKPDSDQDARLNTLLAEQLEALRNKLDE